MKPVDRVLQLRKAPFQIRYIGRSGRPSVFASWNPDIVHQWSQLRDPLVAWARTGSAAQPSSLYVHEKALAVFEGWNAEFTKQWGSVFASEDVKTYKAYRGKLGTEPLLLSSGRNYANFLEQPDGTMLYSVDSLNDSTVASYPRDTIFLVLFDDKDYDSKRAREMQFYSLRWAPLTIRFAAPSEPAGGDWEGFVFQWGYAPRKKYVLSMSSKHSVDLDIEGKTTVVKERLRDVQLPVRLKSDETSRSIITTGEADRNGIILFTGKVIEKKTLYTRGGEEFPGSETGEIESFSGLIDPATKKMGLLDVTGRNLPPGAKDAMARVLEDAQNGLQLPDYPLRIGDAHTRRQKTEIEIPMPGYEAIAGIVVTTYTLKRIVTPLAFFDVRMDCEIDSKNLAGGLSAACKGTGSLRFDMQERLPREYLLSKDMTLEVDTPEARNSVRSRSTTKIEYMTQ